MKKIYLLSLFAVIFFAAPELSAQTFSDVDIWPGTGGSNPVGMIEFNGKVYFSAAEDTLVTGNELWVSDGTPAGTVLVKDIWPGPHGSNPGNFTVVGSQLFFTASDSLHGSELWVTDGTGAGTVLVSDIWPGPGGSDDFYFTSFNGKLYFSADDSVHGQELWVSDGTGAGTSMIKDILPGTGNSSPQGFALNATGGVIFMFNEFNNKLFFRANDGVHGFELWATDGTTGGTTMIADILPGPGGSAPYFITAFNGSLFFAANDSTNGYELWTSDGTMAGTMLLKNINPNTGGSSLADNSGFMPLGSKLYFTAAQDATGNELWSTDGTTVGTAMVKDIWPGPGSSGAGFYSMAPYNGKLYFGAADSLDGMQLWTSDGTPGGTTLLKVLSTYTPYNAIPLGFIGFNNQLIFRASIDTINEYQLWATDGTAGGTRIISPAIAPNTDPLGYDNAYIPFCVANGSLFMSAGFNSIGDELWIYGFAAGISGPAGDQAINAYPNPFGSMVTLSGLESSDSYTICVTDISGRECYSTGLEHPASSASVSLPEMSTGIYLMKVSGQNNSQTFRLVRE